MRTKYMVTTLTALISMGGIGSRLAAEDRIPETNYYAAYYDGKYGTIADGYWGRHGKFFWYKDRSDQWHRDDGAHFQREAAIGFTIIHGSGIARQH